MSGRGRIAFYSERAYPVLTGTPGFAGGAEVLVGLMARGLVARGYDVHLVTCDFGQPETQVLDGITVHRTFPPEGGVPVLRFFHPRLTAAVRGLQAADPEVVYVIGAGMPAGLAHDVARWHRAAFVLHAMSDYDVGPDLARHNPRDRWWYRRALHDTDLLFAQTRFQQEAFRAHHGVASEILPNIVAIPDAPVDAGQDGHVMWLGTYKEIKRPEWFTRLARVLPERRFVMTGVVPPPPLTSEHYDAACAAAGGNLEVLGYQPDPELQALLRGASLLVHTSPQEGFSNVMLEAWALGLPTVAAVNPDGLVDGLGLGEVVAEFGELVDAVRRWTADPARRREAGARARRYVLENHAADVVLDRLTGHLDRLVAQVRHRRGGGR